MSNYNIDLTKPITTGKLINSHVNKTYELKSRDETFDSILKQTIEKKETIKFSKHARDRIQARNINITKNDVDKICKAFELARQKGVKNSLVIVDDFALIVNVPSKTVVTAMDGYSMRQNVFTNIDGAVIV